MAPADRLGAHGSLATCHRDTERPPLDHRFVAVEPTTGAQCTVEVFAASTTIPSALARPQHWPTST
ncbi:MAG: hypothetical protein WBF75_11690 [Pseudonocardiaceae bacterium]